MTLTLTVFLDSGFAPLRDHEAGRGRVDDGGPILGTRDQRADLLPVEGEAWQDGERRSCRHREATHALSHSFRPWLNQTAPPIATQQKPMRPLKSRTDYGHVRHDIRFGIDGGRSKVAESVLVRSVL